MTRRGQGLGVIALLVTQAGCSLILFGDDREGDYRRTIDSPTFDALPESHTFPSRMQVDEQITVRVQVRNVGALPLPADGRIRLNSVNAPKALWSVEWVLLEEETLPNQIATFEFEITAPSTTGQFEHAWQMARLDGSAVEPIGTVLRVPVEVGKHDAAVVTQVVPQPMRPGLAQDVAFTFRNNGDRSWPSAHVRLTTPHMHWGTTSVALSSDLAIGAEHTFQFEFIGPSVPGRYDSEWQLQFDDGRSRYQFGEAAYTRSIEVTSCGDSTVQADRGEQCDDGNRADGDGCTGACAVEPAQIDLSLDYTGRAFLGSVSQGGLGSVAVADVIGDRRINVLMGEALHREDVMPQRARAGRLNGYDVTADLFDSTDPVRTPDLTVFRILGADRDDNLGASKDGAVLTALFRPGGVPDIVVSAPGAAGVDNDRPGAGEVYVFRGGTANLWNGGTIDVGLDPKTLLARIVGSTGSTLTALCTGDLTGDGKRDLVVGAKGDDTNGENAGAVFVIDGSLLTGVVDLVDRVQPAIAAVILGATAGDQLGEFAAAGDFMGDDAADLVVGAPSHEVPGRRGTGAVWGLVGPLEGTIDLAADDADLTIIGANDDERLGISLGVGQVTGSTTADLVVGALRLRNAGAQTGGLLIWKGPIRPGILDLGDGPALPPDTVVYSPDPQDRGGATLGLGDMNADGFLDIAMASSLADGPENGRDQAGEVAVILGGPILPPVIDLQNTRAALTVWGPGAVSRMGYFRNNLVVADVNGDAAADLVVGSPFYGAAREGRVDIILSPWPPGGFR